MTAYRALLDRFTVGDKVRHPLWPELGTGRLTWLSKASENNHSNPVAKVHWATGQHSTHSLLVLRVAT